MDKSRVVKALIEVFSAKLASFGDSIESTRRQARDAPGANVSHSDTSKFQLSNVQLGLSGEKGVIGESLAYLRSFPIDETMAAGGVGALVRLGNPDGERHYLLVLKGGGETVSIDGVPVTSLSAGAPLGRSCMKKEVGDTLFCNGKEYEVLDIW